MTKGSLEEERFVAGCLAYAESLAHTAYMAIRAAGPRIAGKPEESETLKQICGQGQKVLSKNASALVQALTSEQS